MPSGLRRTLLSFYRAGARRTSCIGASNENSPHTAGCFSNGQDRDYQTCR